MDHHVSLQQVAEILETTVPEEKAAVILSGLCPVDRPEKGGISFWAKKGTPDLEALRQEGLEALIVSNSLDLPAAPKGLTLLRVEKPQLSIARLGRLFKPELRYPSGIHETAVISDKASVDPTASVGPYCVIEQGAVVAAEAVLHSHVVMYRNTKVGARTVLHSRVVLREDCVIGDDCCLQPGTVVGADGFGYVPDPQRGLIPIPQIGNVVIEDRVEIGANSCIDRGTLGATTIAAGSKLDNLVQVGHNVEIGTNAILCAQVGIGGSCSIGNQVMLGGQSGVADHLRIADGSRVGAQSGVITPIEATGDYAGHPARPVGEWKRENVVLSRLRSVWAPLRKMLREMEGNT